MQRKIWCQKEKLVVQKRSCVWKEMVLQKSGCTGWCSSEVGFHEELVGRRQGKTRKDWFKKERVVTSKMKK